MRSHYLLVTIFLLDTFQEIFQLQTQLRTAWQPQRKTCSHCCRECKQFQLLTDLTMVAFLGFFHQYQVFVQHLLLREGDTVKTNQLFAFFVATPVCTGYAHYLNGFQVRGIRQVRTAAEVCKRTLRIGRNLTVFQLTDKLGFIFFTSVTKHFQRVSFRYILTFDLLFLSHQFQHFSFDSRKIAFFDNSVTRIHVIVESILDSRSDTELDAGIQFLQSFSHQVGTRVPECMLTFFVFPLEKLDSRILVDRTAQVPNLTIHACCQNFLCQTGTDAFRNLHSSRSFGVFFYGIIRKCNLYHNLFTINS